MDISESFRVSDDMTKSSDLFDFVVNASDHAVADNMNALPQFNRSLKSLGIYLEATELAENNNNNNNNSISDSNNNDNNNKSVGVDHKEPNNNHLMVTNGAVQYTEGVQSYWSGNAIKEDPVVRWDHSMLEDLNCWTQENGSDSSAGISDKIMCTDSNANPDGDVNDRDTDGAIYTLTVLNGSDQGSTWYRLPDPATTGRQNDVPETETDRGRRLTPRPSSVTPSIDFDSLLNNILPTSIHHLTTTSSFASYLTVNSQDILAVREPEADAADDPNVADAIKPTEFLYEDAGYHDNTDNRPTLRIPYNSAMDNHSSNHSNSSCSNSNTNNNSGSNKCSSSSSNSNNNNNNISSNSCTSNSSNNVSNNSDWKLPTEQNQSGSASDARVNSLLRNALQGKPTSTFGSRYNGAHVRGPVQPAVVTKSTEKPDVSSCKEVSGFPEPDDAESHPPLMAVSLESGAVVMFDRAGPPSALVDPEHNPASAQSMDDIFLSQLDSVGYGEDYEKLKSIENEVAKSVEQYCANPYFGTPSAHLAPEPMPSVSHHLDHALINTSAVAAPAKSSKKYSKKSSNKNAGGNPSHDHQLLQNAPGNGIRKERSLHYCTICHKGFKDKYSVNVHVRTHTGEKPFTCTYCGKNFRQKAHLAKHHHTHSVQKTATSSALAPGSNPNKPHTTKHR